MRKLTEDEKMVRTGWNELGTMRHLLQRVILQVMLYIAFMSFILGMMVGRFF